MDGVQTSVIVKVSQMTLMSSQIWESLGSVSGFPDDSEVKNLPANAGEMGDKCSIPGSERSLEEKMKTHSSYSCLENPRDTEVWWVTVHGVAKSQTQLRLPCCCLVTKYCRNAEGKMCAQCGKAEI